MKPASTIFLFALLFITGCTSHDLTTDDGILEVVNANRERSVDLDDLCIKQFDELEEIILIGYFVDEIGCEFKDLFVGDDFGPIVDQTQAGLKVNGWVVETNREELAFFWLQNIVFATGNTRVLTTEPKTFAENNQMFQPPQLERDGEGSVAISYWSVVTWDSAGQSFYSKQKIDFSADGEMSEPRVSKKFTVTYSN